MRIAGHTLGTPGYSVPEAIQLFHKAGLDGAEIIWQDDYSAAIPESGSQALVDEIKSLAQDLELEIVALTPYMSGYNSLDSQERERDIERLKHCIGVAAELNCSYIRVYAGSFKPGDNGHDEKWKRLVESLIQAGEFAGQAGVILCVENHFNTMTVSATETTALMKDIGSPDIGILYDQANLTFTHNETYEKAIPLQSEWIRYVHVKDLVFTDPEKPFVADAVAVVKAEERTIRSRPVGEGILDWPAILKQLINTGYDGFLSLEYEYRWHPQDLPEPGAGFKSSADTLKKMLAELEQGA
ncbi:sugar phosphate isomerase/epimerase family protein [Chloroflexota bacterium]